MDPSEANEMLELAFEERDEFKRKYNELANEMVYEGNSVSWWKVRADAYKAALGEAWEALQEAGIHPDGQINVADAIRKLAKEAK